MKYANAYGTLKSHVEIIIASHEKGLTDYTSFSIDRLKEAYAELHNEDGTLKEVEGKDDEKGMVHS